MSKHSCVDRLSTSPCGLHPASRRRRPPTHRGDEPVQRLPSLRVLDRDGAQVVAEPDGGDDAARVAVGDVLLQRNERKARVRDSDSNRVSRGMWEWAAQGPRQQEPSSLNAGRSLPHFIPQPLHRGDGAADNSGFPQTPLPSHTRGPLTRSLQALVSEFEGRARLAMVGAESPGLGQPGLPGNPKTTMGRAAGARSDAPNTAEW